MSFYGHRDGLLWSSLFSFQDEKEKEKMLKQIQDQSNEYTADRFAVLMHELSGNVFKDYWNDPCFPPACERVALKFMLCDSNFARELLSEEELSKANEVFARKQYNSKNLKRLLTAFQILLQGRKTSDFLQNLFTIPILDEIQKVREEEVVQEFGKLKKVIERVSAGVKSSCYYEAEFSLGISTRLNDALNTLLLDKKKYDFNAANESRTEIGMSTLFCNREKAITQAILRSALIDDDEFWEGHERFDVVCFVNTIVEQNDLRHAEKVWSFIADNLQKMKHMDIVFRHGFPLWMSLRDELVEQLEEQAYRFSFKRLEPYCDVSVIKTIHLCYPMNRPDRDAFDIGKKVWDGFIGKYNYPNDSDKIRDYLKTEVERFVSGETHKDDDIAAILDISPFRCAADNEDRRLFTAYHPDCFSAENIWKRVYLKAYAVTRLSSDEQTQYAYLQRIYIDLIKEIEKRLGICTVHQMDIKKRTENYEKLKDILSANGVPVSDEHSNDYIVSLLDRDTAMMDEAKLFPVLEQTGDAIYGLAVAELLFYNPETDNMPQLFEQFTRAEAQVTIAKKLGLDALFLRTGLPTKYLDSDSLSFDWSEEYVSNEKTEEFRIGFNREKYLADSLEMIIGSVYRDAGSEQAFSLVKKLLRETFPDRFDKEEIHPVDANRYDGHIEGDYWSRILPSPCAPMSREQNTLWNALDKAVLVITIGTDGKNKRNFITHSLGNTAVYGEKRDFLISWVFYDYLNNGLAHVLEKYGDTVREYYNNHE